ncbi:hypothetical protein GGQ73_002821 [Rhizobium skierniewicense]|uniref:Uncharacterized protein n=1 Tax=Rhizobium skierniewicense TaxID=984260 RepID=A0A7W6G2I6_9HYPH|nr:hypothetical protein [Rhizobium skierniewicense]
MRGRADVIAFGKEVIFRLETLKSLLYCPEIFA